MVLSANFASAFNICSSGCRPIRSSDSSIVALAQSVRSATGPTAGPTFNPCSAARLYSAMAADPAGNFGTPVRSWRVTLPISSSLRGVCASQTKNPTGIGPHLGARNGDSYQDLKSAMLGVLNLTICGMRVHTQFAVVDPKYDLARSGTALRAFVLERLSSDTTRRSLAGAFVGFLDSARLRRRHLHFASRRPGSIQGASEGVASLPAI
jgi:hypothetical protein